MQSNYVICENPSCSFSGRGWKGSIKFCPECGEKVLYECPHCDNLHIRSTEFTSKGQMFCKLCGERIKPPPEKESRPKNPKLSLVPKEKPHKKRSKQNQNQADNGGLPGRPDKPA